MLANGRQNLIEYPLFKLFCRWQFAVNNQAVQISFGDKSHTDFAVGALWVRCVAFHDVADHLDKGYDELRAIIESVDKLGN